MEEYRVTSKHLEFVGDDDGYRVRCLECNAEFYAQPPNGSYDETITERVIDHLSKKHGVTERQMRDDVQCRVDDAIKRGEIDPPHGSRN